MVEVGQGGEEVTGFGLDGEGDARPVGGVEYGGDRFGQALPGGVRRCVGRGDAAEAVDGVRAEVGGHVHGTDEQRGARGPGVGVRVEEGGAVLAARVQDIAGAGLDGDPEPEGGEPTGDLAGAFGEVRGQGVQVHVVERQADAVVAEVGEEPEGVVEAEVGEPVGAVAEVEGHVGLTFRARERARGTSAMTARPEPGAPARVASAAWSGIMARIPPPTARWVRGGDGLRAACRRGGPAVRR